MFKNGDTVIHANYGVGLIIQVFSGDKYGVYFVTVLRNNGVVRCRGSELSLIDHSSWG